MMLNARACTRTWPRPCSGAGAVKERWYAVLERVHPDYAKGVREACESAPALPVTPDTPIKAAE